MHLAGTESRAVLQSVGNDSAILSGGGKLFRRFASRLGRIVAPEVLTAVDCDFFWLYS